MCQISSYETESDKSPVLEFLDGMSSKAWAKFAQIAIRLSRKDLKSKCPPYSKHFEDGILR